MNHRIVPGFGCLIGSERQKGPISCSKANVVEVWDIKELHRLGRFWNGGQSLVDWDLMDL